VIAHAGLCSLLNYPANFLRYRMILIWNVPLNNGTVALSFCACLHIHHLYDKNSLLINNVFWSYKWWIHDFVSIAKVQIRERGCDVFHILAYEKPSHPRAVLSIIASNLRWKRIVNGEWVRISKEVVVAYFKLQSQHVTRETGNSHKGIPVDRPRFESWYSTFRQQMQKYNATSCCLVI
jgi:hypothetical protein